MVVRPSGWVKVQVPFWWVIVMSSVWIQSWQRQQNNPEFATEVTPPRVHQIRWWTSQSLGWCVAARAAAGLVPGDHRPALRGGHGALRAADVQGLGVGSEHDPGDLAVAGDPLEHAPRDRLPGLGEDRRVHPGLPGLGGERVPADRDGQVRADLRPAAAGPGVQEEPGQVTQGVRVALPGAAPVVGCGDADDRPQRGPDQLGGLRGQQPTHVTTLQGVRDAAARTCPASSR